MEDNPPASATTAAPAQDPAQDAAVDVDGGGNKAPPPIDAELWHACAGPLVSLPTVGSNVVYFPQGHLEQVAASIHNGADVLVPSYPNVPSKLICLLQSLTLHADPETDETYAEMSLVPLNSCDREPVQLPELAHAHAQPLDNFFSKTLTACDTSNQVSFSVPPRLADKIFPPLDLSTHESAQELQARDLHDNVWSFRHIYNRTSELHLLTTGWSLFVSRKRLLAGDSVIFVRNEKQQLLVGIKRASRQPTNTSPVLSRDSILVGVLAAAAHAAANHTKLNIVYNPWSSPCEFVIPFAKYQEALRGCELHIGMRLYMMIEERELTTRRLRGSITRMRDFDQSEWRTLKVAWEDDTGTSAKPEWVSVWEIEPTMLKRPRELEAPDDDESEMAKRRMPSLGEEMQDSTTSLPTSVHAGVLSLLPIRTAIQCGAVSKAWLAAWRELLDSVVELDFGEEFAGEMSLESYLSVVASVLMQVQSAVPRTVRLILHVRSSYQMPHVRALLESVTSGPRKPLLDLTLIMDPEFPELGMEGYPDRFTPWSFDGALHCWRSLRKLSLRWDGPELLPLRLMDERLELPNLHMLSLDRVRVDSYNPAVIFESCPLLLELVLKECYGFRNIDVPSLQCLEIVHRYSFQYSMAINAPALRSFRLDGNMEMIELGDASSLEDVYLRNRERWFDENGELNEEVNWGFLYKISPISMLTLWDDSVVKYLADYCSDEPTLELNFCNLRTLVLLNVSLQLFVILMRICSAPLLERLFIEFALPGTSRFAIVDGLLAEFLKELDGEDEDQVAIAHVALSQLRFVSLRGCLGLGDLLGIVDFLLRNAAALETLVLYIDTAWYSEKGLASFAGIIDAIPKASKNVQVQFHV